MSVRFISVMLAAAIAFIGACKPDDVVSSGVEPVLFASPERIAFGNCTVGRERTASVMLVNRGKTSLALHFATEGNDATVFIAEQRQLQIDED